MIGWKNILKIKIFQHLKRKKDFTRKDEQQVKLKIKTIINFTPLIFNSIEIRLE